MAQPTPFNRSIDYSEYAADHPSAPFNSEALDTDIANLVTTTSELITNIGLIQRDDGMLANESVGVDTIDGALKLLIAAGEDSLASNVKGQWLTATSYVKGNIASNSNITYLAAIDHTSGVLATDVAAGKWVVLFNNAASAASGVTFSPTGGIAATNVQAAIAEVDSEKLSKASNLSDLTALQTARDNLQVSSKSQDQLQTYTYFADSGVADAMVVTPTPAIATAYTNGLKLDIKALNTNVTTAPTLNVSGLGAKVCFYPNGNSLLPSDIVANRTYSFVYNASLNSGAGGWGVYGISLRTPGTSGKMLTSFGSTSQPDWTTPFLAATNAQTKASSATDVGITPASAKHIPGAAKAWAWVEISAGAVSDTALYNFTSISDNGVGDFTLNFTNQMASGKYVTIGTAAPDTSSNSYTLNKYPGVSSATSVRILIKDDGATNRDPTVFSVAVFGELA